jgi:hypothetical protein
MYRSGFFPAGVHSWIPVVVITWTLILDPGSWMLDFASLHCTAWIQPAIQTMSNVQGTGLHMHAYHMNAV